MSTIEARPEGRSPVSEAHEPAGAAATGAPTVAVRRRTIDLVLVAAGAVVTVVLFAAGALLTWGSNFASDYVNRELTAQNIYFPDQASLEEEGRTDLFEPRRRPGLHRGGGPGLRQLHQRPPGVHRGRRHLRGASVPRRNRQGGGVGGRQGLQRSPRRRGDRPAGQRPMSITNQRNTLFKGETLHGLLLSAYAWSTVGHGSPAFRRWPAFVPRRRHVRVGWPWAWSTSAGSVAPEPNPRIPRGRTGRPGRPLRRVQWRSRRRVVDRGAPRCSSACRGRLSLFPAGW